MFTQDINNLDDKDRKIRLGQVNTISKSVDTSLAPVDLFRGLCDKLDLNNNMLLESSEIESKENVKSILMLDAALRIECNGHQVAVDALTDNGKNALAFIAEQILQDQKTIEFSSSETRLNLQFAARTKNIDEDTRLKTSSPIDILRSIKTKFEEDKSNELSIFLCGLFSFDFIATFEDLPEVTPGRNTCPDFVFYLAESILIIDHQSNSKRLLLNHFSGKNQKNTYFELARRFQLIESKLNQLSAEHDQCPPTSSIENSSVDINIDCDQSNQSYENTVVKLKSNIIQGDVFQVVPSRTFSLPCKSPIESYSALKEANPSPYMFYMQDQDFILFGASPESALKYTKKTNEVLLYPIAGTRPRGKDANGEVNLDLDARIEAELKLDQKELAEHMMLVDLARNDIARISKPGSTHVPRLLAVDRYSQVMHLVSCVQGQLREDLDALHAYQACMNMGTLTGAPKIKATQLIRQVEKQRRGSYGGAVGYINGRGDMDTCIVIRAAFYRDGIAHVQAGAGIVYDSDPAMEAQETESKASAVIKAIQTANTLCSSRAQTSEGTKQ